MAASTLTALVRRILPRRLRVAMAGWFATHRGFPGANRWSEGLIRDLQESDVKEFHKFLWTHHLDRYGLAYEAGDLFSSGKLNSTTQAYEAFLEDLTASAQEVGGLEAMGSVLDVGCSVGHVLRGLETDLISDVPVLVGMDIDRHAIAAGTAFLSQVGSKIRLVAGDLEELGDVLGDERFDFSYAAGSLSYLSEGDTREAVRAILGRTERLAAFIGLANPGVANSEMPGSRFRDELGRMWTHNFEEMVVSNGWSVVRSRWEPPGEGDAQGLYSVWARPGMS